MNKDWKRRYKDLKTFLDISIQLSEFLGKQNRELKETIDQRDLQILEMRDYLDEKDLTSDYLYFNRNGKLK